ncbi:26S proteasome non-ATPase regulatory subunit RPN12A [Platanthera zijinensis]|uniref:26S proteasome non-ATPase regulatory subunit RPN12A n=1 Tax=Platanthera zijinensis TaxID=2320716 RepID=A0AAP0G0L3_9ASPA
MGRLHRHQPRIGRVRTGGRSDQHQAAAASNRDQVGIKQQQQATGIRSIRNKRESSWFNKYDVEAIIRKRKVPVEAHSDDVEDLVALFIIFLTAIGLIQEVHSQPHSSLEKTALPLPSLAESSLLVQEVLIAISLVNPTSMNSLCRSREATTIPLLELDARVGLIPPSPEEYPILGLNLLRLLVQNRISEFHRELELLPAAALENPCIRHAVELEQSFMEGAYNRVLSARQTVQPETYAYFMDLLAKTVRDEIAGCSEKAYDSLSVADAKKILMFSSDQELLTYIDENEDATVHLPDRAKSGLGINSSQPRASPTSSLHAPKARTPLPTAAHDRHQQPPATRLRQSRTTKGSAMAVPPSTHSERMHRVELGQPSRGNDRNEPPPWFLPFAHQMTALTESTCQMRERLENLRGRVSSLEIPPHASMPHRIRYEHSVRTHYDVSHHYVKRSTFRRNPLYEDYDFTYTHPYSTPSRRSLRYFDDYTRSPYTTPRDRVDPSTRSHYVRDDQYDDYSRFYPRTRVDHIGSSTPYYEGRVQYDARYRYYTSPLYEESESVHVRPPSPVRRTHDYPRARHDYVGDTHYDYPRTTYRGHYRHEYVIPSDPPSVPKVNMMLDVKGQKEHSTAHTRETSPILSEIHIQDVWSQTPCEFTPLSEPTRDSRSISSLLSIDSMHSSPSGAPSHITTPDVTSSPITTPDVALSDITLESRELSSDLEVVTPTLSGSMTPSDGSFMKDHHSTDGSFDDPPLEPPDEPPRPYVDVIYLDSTLANFKTWIPAPLSHLMLIVLRHSRLVTHTLGELWDVPLTVDHRLRDEFSYVPPGEPPDASLFLSTFITVVTLRALLSESTPSVVGAYVCTRHICDEFYYTPPGEPPDDPHMGSPHIWDVSTFSDTVEFEGALTDLLMLYLVTCTCIDSSHTMLTHLITDVSDLHMSVHRPRDEFSYDPPSEPPDHVPLSGVALESPLPSPPFVSSGLVEYETPGDYSIPVPSTHWTVTTTDVDFQIFRDTWFVGIDVDLLGPLTRDE